MFECQAITVRYEGACAVDDVSLVVDEGEWVSLIGPNGAGKSSLLRAVASLTPHDGTVVLDGARIDHLSHRRYARLVAFVPQKPELPAGMSVLEYTMLGRTPHIGYLGVESDSDRILCADLLARLGIPHLADRSLPTLSGGELQRAALARALAQQAPVLLLDEPTSALDLGNRVNALELVDALRREYRLTVISVMHDLTLAGQFSDRLALLVDGRLDAVDDPTVVLQEERLSRAFGGRVRVLRGDDGDLVVAPARTRRARGHTQRGPASRQRAKPRTTSSRALPTGADRPDTTPPRRNNADPARTPARRPHETSETHPA